MMQPMSGNLKFRGATPRGCRGRRGRRGRTCRAGDHEHEGPLAR
jgi:hypothetical protein